MTIKDIAKECGCGVGTVSRVLNNHPDVSGETRAKVMSVVDKYGFVLNKNASLLKSQDNRTIEILVKGTSSPLLNEMLSIVLNRMEGLSYNASVVVLDEYDNEALVANRVYYEHKPQAMMFLGGNPDRYGNDFEKIKIPCVLVSNESTSVSNAYLSSVSTDDVAASEYAAEYLIKKGHKKIGVIGGDLGSSDISKKRYEGFLNAMKKHGLDFDEEKAYAVSKYGFESAASAARNLIKRYPDLTAVFTMADSMAIGACRALIDMGYSVPQDISITGFDGLPYADFYSPRITTIRQQTERLVDDGLAILLKSLERNEPSKHELIPFEFVEGESVRNLI